MGRGAFQAVPQWTFALIALVIVLTVNMISVKLFGEMEFWAVRIRVVALATFLVVGIEFLAGRSRSQARALACGHRRQRRHPAAAVVLLFGTPYTTPHWCSWPP